MISATAICHHPRRPEAGESMRYRLIYGRWTTADGTEVMFDRRYRPRWRRKPDGVVEPADPSQWIDEMVEEFLVLQRSHQPFGPKKINARIAAEWRLP